MNKLALQEIIQAKFILKQELPKFLASLSTKDLPLVFTNGVFDILHLGHLSYLAQAKSLGNKLIVAINSDSSVKMLNKGDDRPINNQDNRLSMLASLVMVDYVIIFEEQTPLNLLSQIKPQIYVKGGDYSLEYLPETPLVHSWNGEVKILPFVDGYSTTSFLQKIRT